MPRPFEHVHQRGRTVRVTRGAQAEGGKSEQNCVCLMAENKSTHNAERKNTNEKELFLHIPGRLLVPNASVCIVHWMQVRGRKTLSEKNHLKLS